jgi:hypothetical protein
MLSRLAPKRGHACITADATITMQELVEAKVPINRVLEITTSKLTTNKFGNAVSSLHRRLQKQ